MDEVFLGAQANMQEAARQCAVAMILAKLADEVCALKGAIDDELTRARQELADCRADLETARQTAMSLADRVACQAELLSQRAEKKERAS